jgi:Fic family protein
MWSTMRAAVIESFPQAPGLPDDPEAYMASVKESYVRDAYNSLSIEGYKVTNELIERVASGTWSPETDGADKQSKDAMAARGYFQSRKAVEESIRKILAGDNSGSVVSKDHRTWYRDLFAPSVDAKILKPSDLAGYRGHQVFITNAAHVPPPVAAVRDMMPAFFDLLQSEPDPSVRAVLGHFIFVFTHPYMDGNGRMGRFIMNSMLASGGYPWTVVEVSRRSEYMRALNEASSKGDIRPFADFIASSVDNELQKKPAARKQRP